MRVETTLEQMRESKDWQEAFAYAFAPAYLEAWNDLDWWGSQEAGGRSAVADTLEVLLRYGVTQEQHERLDTGFVEAPMPELAEVKDAEIELWWQRAKASLGVVVPGISPEDARAAMRRHVTSFLPRLLKLVRELLALAQVDAEEEREAGEETCADAATLTYDGKPLGPPMPVEMYELHPVGSRQGSRAWVESDGVLTVLVRSVEGMELTMSIKADALKEQEALRLQLAQAGITVAPIPPMDKL